MESSSIASAAESQYELEIRFRNECIGWTCDDNSVELPLARSIELKDFGVDVCQVFEK